MLFKEYKSEIDEAFLYIDFEIEGKKFHANMKEYLIHSDKLRELTEDEVTYLLESCSAWRETFLSAYALITAKREKEESDFKFWYADHEDEAREDILHTRELTMKKPISSTTISVSAGEIDNWIRRRWEDEYREKEMEIIDLKAKERVLRGTYQNLISRGMELQSLLKGKNVRFEGEIKDHGVFD